MKVHNCIFFQLSKASLAGTAFWSSKVKHLGITASQAMVLNFLGEEDRIPPHTLRQKLKITSATMTGILDRLEKLALIERKPHAADRRAILACLTESGARYAKEINTIMIRANQSFLKGFDPESVQQLQDMLRQIQSDKPKENKYADS